MKFEELSQKNEQIDIVDFLSDNEKLEKVLFPMFEILDKKNITKGVTYSVINEKLYVCFDKNGLSPSNQLILEKIAVVYSETIFYSDDIEHPNLDRLEYWCPDLDYGKRTNIVERCKNKKLFVLELALTDMISVLGITIMLANTLQEQNPMCLKINEDLVVLEPDILEREKHYNESGCPDLRWINLTISLNQDNPLRENPYAPFMNVCEINTPVECDNLILSIFAGANNKKYLTFKMENEEIEKVIKEYFENKCYKKEHTLVKKIEKK